MMIRCRLDRALPNEGCHTLVACIEDKVLKMRGQSFQSERTISV